MLPRDLIAKVRKIEIRTRKLVEDLTGGAYHSVFKGRGIEFSEVREYTPEDMCATLTGTSPPAWACLTSKSMRRNAN